MSGTRALGRWALRATLREWRQQLVVSILLVTTVAVAVCANLVAFNAAPPEASYLSDFTVSWFDLQGREADEATGEPPVSIAEELAQLDRIGAVPLAQLLQQPVPAPTATGAITLRHQTTPPKQLSTRLALRDGSWPEGPAEAAITETAGKQLGATLGQTTSINDSTFKITGFVEDPSSLSSDFVLVDQSLISEPDQALVLFDAKDRIFERVPDLSGGGFTIGGPTAKQDALRGSTVITSFVILLTALMAVSGFSVIAKRRLRQIGMLGSIGAEPAAIQKGLILHGLVVGSLSAAIGALIGTMIAAATAPQIEGFLDHRVNFSISVAGVLVPLLTSIFFATAAAWWPARQFSKVSPVDALASRVPHADRVRSLGPRIGLGLLAAGIIGIVASSGSWMPSGDFSNIVRVLCVMSATIGLLLLSPLVVSFLAKLASNSVLPFRLAGRIAQRNNARSSISMAAVSLTIALPLALVLLSASADKQSTPDIAENLALLSARSTVNDAGLQSFTGTVPSATIVPISNPTGITLMGEVNSDGLAEQMFGDEAVVGDAAVMEALELESNLLDKADVILFSDTPYTLRLQGDSNFAGLPPPETDVRFTKASSSAAGGLIKAVLSPDLMERKALASENLTWFIDNSEPLTVTEQVALQKVGQGLDVRVSAAELGNDTSLLRTAAVLMSLLLSGAILALTVALHRAEDTQRYRTMAAIGAAPTANRSVAAATAGLFSLGGLILGLPIAFLGWFTDVMGSPAQTLSSAFTVPVVPFLAIVVGVTLLAAALAWLSERQPRNLNVVHE